MVCLEKEYIDGRWDPKHHICHNFENCQYLKYANSANLEIGKALVDIIKAIEHPKKNIDYYKKPLSIDDDNLFTYPQLSAMPRLVKKWALEKGLDEILKKLISLLTEYEKALEGAEIKFRKQQHKAKISKKSRFKFKTEKSNFNTVDIGEKRFHLLRKIVICPAYI